MLKSIPFGEFPQRMQRCIDMGKILLDCPDVEAVIRVWDVYEDSDKFV